MRHADVRGLTKARHELDDDYDGFAARSVDDSYHTPYSPNSSSEYMDASGTGRQEHSLFTFVQPKKTQSKKNKNKNNPNQVTKVVEEEAMFYEESPSQTRGRLPSREYGDFQFEMEPEENIRSTSLNEGTNDAVLTGDCAILSKHSFSSLLLATPVRQKQTETLSSRVNTLKISERTDRSVSPKKPSKSTMDSPSVTPRQGVSPVATSRRNETASSVTSTLKRRAAPVDRANALKDYNERLEGRDLLSLVVVGHVDAGKSTLMGHLLVKLKVVDDRTVHKNCMEAQRLGKDSFSFAFVLDESEEERQRGVTMDIAHAQFKTKTKIVNLVDAPGHKGQRIDHIPSVLNELFHLDCRFYSKYDQWSGSSGCGHSRCR